MTTWHPRFATGHSEIDQEHQRFFLHLETLDHATRKERSRTKVVDTIVQLQEYALNHFAHDETYMSQIGCRPHPENFEEHREFALRLEGWRFLLSTTATPVSLATEVHREAIAWIESHIAHNDCKLRACRCFELAVAG
jgi:hemerythrin